MTRRDDTLTVPAADEPWFDSDEHAYISGQVLMLLCMGASRMTGEVQVMPVLDEAGNYTTQILLRADYGDFYVSCAPRLDGATS